MATYEIEMSTWERIIWLVGTVIEGVLSLVLLALAVYYSWQSSLEANVMTAVDAALAVVLAVEAYRMGKQAWVGCYRWAIREW